jgi:hypothetical protein
MAAAVAPANAAPSAADAPGCYVYTMNRGMQRYELILRPNGTAEVDETEGNLDLDTSEWSALRQGTWQPDPTAAADEAARVVVSLDGNEDCDGEIIYPCEPQFTLQLVDGGDAVCVGQLNANRKSLHARLTRTGHFAEGVLVNGGGNPSPPSAPSTPSASDAA